ncbi:MAG: DUF1045 domain-containing protein [Pseudomonadota bacterium]
MTYNRYAVYFVPAPGPLADFGAAWLGWDVITGKTVAPPDVPGLSLPWNELTKTPRKYGLHATIKPPFRLAPGMSADALLAALEAHCKSLAPVTLDGLELAQLGRFLALVPQGDTTALRALAATTVRTLDPFRAPPTEAELNKRRASGLTPHQDALLQEWGYPYVMDQFRCHITLTDKLPKACATQTRNALDPHVTPLIPRPFFVDALCLAGEGDLGRFHLIHRFALSG